MIKTIEGFNNFIASKKTNRVRRRNGATPDVANDRLADYLYQNLIFVHVAVMGPLPLPVR